MTKCADDQQTHSGNVNYTHPENCVEYCLFLIEHETQTDSRWRVSQLEVLRKAALEFTNQLTGDYIWQKDSLNLEIVTHQGVAYLRGVSDYGDAIEDEWLIVYVLREFSRLYPAAWVRVFDSDGEFLLVEAANVLPKWLSPENDHHRVWINNGRLRIIPIDPGQGSRLSHLSLADALSTIRNDAGSLIHSEFIEAEAFYRLEKYPDQIQKSIHYSLVTIPRRLAYVLHQVPKAVAPAVESFYLRDALDLKALLSPEIPLRFPPQDLITMSVKFTRVLFAQLRSQRFAPPKTWLDLIQQSHGKESDRVEMGMKLTCGFEMMLNNIDKNDSRDAREAGIIIEDLEEDGDAALPGDEEINAWKDVRREDSESWMDINYEDFEQELEGSREGRDERGSTGFGDATTQTDLRRIVSRFEAFLNDENAGLEGVELDEMDIDDDESDEQESDEDDEDEDKAVSFDEAEFSRMMSDMMGLEPVDPGPRIQPGKASATAELLTTSVETGNADEEPNDSELRNLAAQLEAELNEYGVLDLDAPRDRMSAVKGREKEAASIKDSRSGNTDLGGYDSDGGEIDVDYNLAKNLLESFRGQAGLPGPASNILGMMGLRLPRDEDDNDAAVGKE